MNRIEHLLTCLAEECSEVQQAVAKALRFGLDDVSPSGQLPCNREYITRELCDVVGVLELLYEEGILVMPENCADLVTAKKEKVRRFMKYAEDRGTLQEGKSNV